MFLECIKSYILYRTTRKVAMRKLSKFKIKLLDYINKFFEEKENVKITDLIFTNIKNVPFKYNLYIYA